VRILVAEDEEQLCAAIARGLRENTYAVDVASDGATALAQARVNRYDAIVLDVMMPEMTGLDVCRALRSQGIDVPILILTARDSIQDRITGLDAGADDYLIKPFAFGELLARLRALLRRRGHVRATVLTIGDLRIDTRSHTVQRGESTISLTAREYSFLEYLARKAGAVVSRAEIVEHVWDENHDPSANLIDVYVSRLRKKVDTDSDVPLMHTRRGAGLILGVVNEGDE
jgi:two-component system copper resistance phosphate regulon response regulator CusR